MSRHLDLKAIGYGIATFMLGFLLLIVVLGVAGNLAPSMARMAGWGMQAGVNLVPVLAGYVSARRASSRPIFHGAIAAALGAAVYLCVTGFLFPPFNTQQIPVLAVFALLGALGSIFGKYRRDKSKP